MRGESKHMQFSTVICSLLVYVFTSQLCTDPNASPSTHGSYLAQVRKQSGPVDSLKACPALSTIAHYSRCCRYKGIAPLHIPPGVKPLELFSLFLSQSTGYQPYSFLFEKPYALVIPFYSR